MSEPEKPLSTPGKDTAVWTATGGFETPRDLTGKTLGDFQVERLLGRGGMGEVYLARQVSLNRPVALKVLRTDLLSKPSYLGRFEAEATAVAKLNHPNIVHVYMLGSVDETRFIAMEYVQGTNLRDYLVKKGAVELNLALAIMKQAGLAVGAAGEIGLVHRDIKPENLMLTRKGQVKVADFGLCRDTDSENVHLTQPGTTMGTPLYMSPEQAQGHTTDHRSDLYSLGVTFYHMLAGSPPFRAETALALALKHVKDTPVRLIVHRPDLPAELDHLVMKLMAKKPADRYQSAAEMLRDLAKIRETLSAPSMVLPAATDLGSGSAGVLTAPPVEPTRASALSSSGEDGDGDGVEGTPAPSGFRIGTGRGISLVTACLAGGLLWGWLVRPVDLLAEGARPSTAMPGLWMSPDWQERNSRQRTAEAQYHHALYRAPAAEQESAWVAVPGYFPTEREYCSKAYIQLTRALLRQRDLDRLGALAAELARWKDDKAHGEELAVIARAGVDALDGNIDGIPQTFGKDVSDPALQELAIEVVAQAIDSAKTMHTAYALRDLQPLLRQLILRLDRGNATEELRAKQILRGMK